MQVRVTVPVRVIIDPDSATSHLDHIDAALTEATRRAMLNAKAIIEKTCGDVVGQQVHEPVVSWSGPGLHAMTADARRRVETLIHTVLTTVRADTLPGSNGQVAHVSSDDGGRPANAPPVTRPPSSGGTTRGGSASPVPTPVQESGPVPTPGGAPARSVIADVLTSSVGDFFADHLTQDQLRQQVALIVDTLEYGVPEPAARQTMEQNLEFLEGYGAAHGITLPAATAHEFRRVIGSHKADLGRHLATIKQLSKIESFPDAFGFPAALEWHADQLAWVIEATGRAVQLVNEAEAGGDASAQKFAEAGTELTAAIFGLRVIAILLTYDDFQYEVGINYPGVTDLPRKGAAMAHHELDSVLVRLRLRLPGSVDSAVTEVSGFNWGFDFSEMKDEVEDQIKNYTRFVGWLNVVMLAWTAFDIWMLPVAGGGSGGAPRIGGMGGAGGAGATVAGTVLTSAESIEALRRLAAIGAVTAPKLVKLVGGRPGGIQAPPKPIEASTKSGRPAGGSGGSSAAGKNPATVKPDPNARPVPGLPTAVEDAAIKRYTRGLAHLRESSEVYRRVQAELGRDPKRISRAQAAYESARRELDALEHEAAGPGGGELSQHLRPHVEARHTIEHLGPNYSPVGRRIDCEAVRLAPKNLRGMDFAEIEKAMQRSPDRVDAAPRPVGGGKATAHQRLEWWFNDKSKLVIDFPRELGSRPKSADLPHAELFGPTGERLDQQGIVVPEKSISAHMTITDHQGLQENHFGPARKGR